MLELNNYLFEITAGLIGLSVLFAINLQRNELSRVRAMLRCERTDRQQLENDLTALLECSKNIGERVKSQEERHGSLLKQLDKGDLTTDTSSNRLYEKVSGFIAKGLSIEEVADVCELRRGEVELLSHIASYRSAA